MPRAPGSTLSGQVVRALEQRIRDGGLGPGDRLPTETALMNELGVSRTVVREALSQLQASGLVETRHGIGTFVRAPGDAAPFRIAPDQMATLKDVVAVLELRIGLETEAAALAARRHQPEHLAAMRAALNAFSAAVAAGGDAVVHDYEFHAGIARATQNVHYVRLLAMLGATTIIPRARLQPVALAADAAGDAGRNAARRAYLRRIHGEHERIFAAISAGDAAAAAAAMREHLARSLRRRQAEQPG